MSTGGGSRIEDMQTRRKAGEELFRADGAPVREKRPQWFPGVRTPPHPPKVPGPIEKRARASAPRFPRFVNEGGIPANGDRPAVSEMRAHGLRLYPFRLYHSADWEQKDPVRLGKRAKSDHETGTGGKGIHWRRGHREAHTLRPDSFYEGGNCGDEAAPILGDLPTIRQRNMHFSEIAKTAGGSLPDCPPAARRGSPQFYSPLSPLSTAICASASEIAPTNWSAGSAPGISRPSPP